MELAGMPIDIYEAAICLYVNNHIKVEEYHRLRGFGWYEIYKHFQHHESIRLDLADTERIPEGYPRDKIHCRLFTRDESCQQGGLVSIW